MKIGAVISEFNPFHSGHEYIIKKFKELMGDNSCVIALMSGDYVQRGEPAIFPKEIRARAAAESSADLVLELPLPYSISSAEGFASYAINLLNELAVVDRLFFGSESADIDLLRTVAEALLKDEITEKITDKMKEGISFPAAREEVLKSEGLLDDNITIKANDILAVEYIKALIKSDSQIKPCAIRRRGAEHDSHSSSKGIASAAHIRKLVFAGETADIYLPEKAAKLYKKAVREGRGPVSLWNMEPMILARLRFLKAGELALLPDAAEGIENLLYKNINRAGNLKEIIELSVSKRYPRSRIKRMLLCAALGISKDDAEKYKKPPYFRVLASNAAGTKILRQIARKSSLPALIKPAGVKKLGQSAESFFELSSLARDFYSLAFRNECYKIPGEEYRLSPFIKKFS